MSAITLTTAQTMLAAYIAAETAVLSGQSYRMGEQSMTKADLAQIQRGRAEWSAAVDRLTADPTNGQIRIWGVTPCG